MPPISAHTSPDPTPATARPESGEITLERLDRARRTAARIVKLHGAQYRPLFERIQREYESRRDVDSLIDELAG